jgi:hemerythrin
LTECCVQIKVVPANEDTGWDPEIYSTGIGIIDEQHAQIFQLAADLRKIKEELDETNQNQAKVQVSMILHELAEYATLHFATEEALFELHLMKNVKALPV